MSEGKVTTDHEEIRRWAEERGGVPSRVIGTEHERKGKREDPGILRLDFEPRDEKLEEIPWEEFFEKFEKEKLAFLYQEETSGGKTSRFHKFINRGTAKQAAEKTSSGAKRTGAAKGATGAKSGGRKKTAASASKS